MHTAKMYRHLPISPLSDMDMERLATDSNCARCSLALGASTICMDAELSNTTGKPVEGDPVMALVLDYPSRNEDATGRPMVGQSGQLLRDLVKKHWKGNVLIDNAVRCSPGRTEVDESNVDACRPYGADRLSGFNGSIDRILTMGTWASYSVLGFKVPTLSARGGYGWYLDESKIEQGMRAALVPVYILPNPTAALRNHFLRKDFVSDFEYAATRPTPAFDVIDAQIKLVEDCNDAVDFVAWAHQQSAVAFDTETAGKMHNRNFRVHAVSFASPDDPSVVWVFGRKALSDPKVVAWLKHILENEDISKIGHNIKYDMLAMWCAFRIQTQAVDLHDTRLIRKLLEATIDGGLDVAATLVGMGGHKREANDAIKAIRKDLAALAGEANRKPLASGKPRAPVKTAYLDRAEVENSHLEEIRAGEDTWTFAYGYLPDDILHRYNAMDAMATAMLFSRVLPRITALPGRLAVYNEVSMTAVRALFEMEKWGLKLDTMAVQQFSMYLNMKLDAIDARLKVYGEVNFDSPKQLAELLYDKLGLTEPKNSRTASGQRGTGEEVLLQLASQHKIVRDILERRTLVKLKGTYADPLIRYRRDDGRVHSTTLTDGAESGRLSSQDPNMQNAPSPDRDEEGGEQYGHMSRDCYVAEDGFIFLEVDTKQQEARVAAKLSGDDVLLGCFSSGEDIHRTTASVVYGIAPGNVTKKQRSDCKTVFFGLLYGKTDYGLAKQLGITDKEAARIRGVILGRFKKLARWCLKQVEFGREHGGVFTWWNGHAEARWRPLYGIAAQGDEGKGQRFNAENSTVNTPIQGLAGDIVTASLWKLVCALREERIEARLVNTVHDSMMVEVRIGQELAAARVMKAAILSQNCEGVDLDVDFKKGASWGSMAEWKPNFSEAA
jgi:uracil-DNA glycosylase family 4